MVEVIPGRFKVKGIYWIHDPRIDKGDPHYRVCIASEDDEISLACCTTGKEKQLARIKFKKQHDDTLVEIDYLAKDNNLKEATYINCETVHHYTEGELLDLEPPRITFHGVISDEEYRKILKGYLLSDLATSYWQQACNNLLNPD